MTERRLQTDAALCSILARGCDDVKVKEGYIYENNDFLAAADLCYLINPIRMNIVFKLYKKPPRKKMCKREKKQRNRYRKREIKRK